MMQELIDGWRPASIQRRIITIHVPCTSRTNQAGFISLHVIHSVAIIWNLINLNYIKINRKQNRKHLKLSFLMYIHVLIKYSSNSTFKKEFGSLSINKSIETHFSISLKQCQNVEFKPGCTLNILETNII